MLARVGSGFGVVLVLYWGKTRAGKILIGIRGGVMGLREKELKVVIKFAVMIPRGKDKGGCYQASHSFYKNVVPHVFE
ncbi:hypothetical protein DVH24_015703 [Malus domestica]|uniref:Uncharacterized protein n=1 Tax=Malus domestica TaxID=3750 RepID=A0A498HPH9_MALDO|nr:hypothetical protein DVH24_015703 [Malus domestica]